MTIEIADRLVKLRKQKGLSQEELAEKLGLSRQAVSKWERAEASPDTDNLICLAKLYGVSLDELLNTEEDLETIVEEQVKPEPEVEVIDSNEQRNAHVHEEGIHCCDGKGNTVDIDNDGIHLKNNKGETKDINKNTWKQENKAVHIANIIEGPLFILAAAAYIILGINCPGKGWSGCWVLFFIPEIICSLIRAIGKKRFCEFNMAFVTVFTFFFINMIHPTNLWGVTWPIFLAIPFYYASLGPVDAFIHRNDPKPVKDKNNKDNQGQN